MQRKDLNKREPPFIGHHVAQESSDYWFNVHTGRYVELSLRKTLNDNFLASGLCGEED